MCFFVWLTNCQAMIVGRWCVHSATMWRRCLPLSIYIKKIVYMYFRSFEVCVCLWLGLTVLRWPCAVDRVLKLKLLTFCTTLPWFHFGHLHGTNLSLSLYIDICIYACWFPGLVTVNKCNTWWVKMCVNCNNLDTLVFRLVIHFL